MRHYTGEAPLPDAPETEVTAGDDFAADTTLRDAAETGAALASPEAALPPGPAASPLIAPPSIAAAPIVTEGWQRHEQFGLGFALPPNFELLELDVSDWRELSATYQAQHGSDGAGPVVIIAFQQQSEVDAMLRGSSQEMGVDFEIAPEPLVLGPLSLTDRRDKSSLLRGKSCLLDRLRTALAGADPQIRGAASLRAGYCDQALAHLDAFRTPWEAVKHSSDVADQQARTLLAGAGIAIDAQTAPVSRLSGGQRARLAVLVLRLVRPNFYLLDEPTNHLDIEGQDMLEGELVDHGAACLLVSHDRAVVRAVATRFWVIDGRRLLEVDDPDPVFAKLMAD